MPPTLTRWFDRHPRIHRIAAELKDPAGLIFVAFALYRWGPR